MAIEYQLKFEEGATLRTLAETLRAAGFADSQDPETFLFPGLTATVGGTQDRFGRWQPLHFRPHVQIFFGHDSHASYDVVMDQLVGTVALCLEAMWVDVAMAYDNEVVLLLRQKGQLVLTNRDDWWTRPGLRPTLAERLGQDYRLEPLPVI